MLRNTFWLALILAIGLANSLSAQQPGPPSPAPVAGPQAQPPVPPFDPFGQFGRQAQNYPGGADESDPFAPPPPAAEPAPQNPVQKVYEKGKIVVIVGSERHFAYHIGDRIALTMIVAADPDVSLDFNSLRKGVFGLSGSDFELAGEPVVRAVGKKNGKIIWRIDLKLRTFVYKDGVTSYGTIFTADFLYATEKTPDGKTPNWKRLTSPEFDVTRSNTADNGENLLEGELDEAPHLISWFTYPLLLAGLSLILLWPTLVFMQWLQRVRPRRKIPANELAWNTFDRVIAEGKAKGFTVKHYKQIAAALRTYLGVESQTLAEIEVTLKDHKDVDAIVSALSKFDSVLYDRGALNDTELRQLNAELKALVPRP